MRGQGGFVELLLGRGDRCGGVEVELHVEGVAVQFLLDFEQRRTHGTVHVLGEVATVREDVDGDSAGLRHAAHRRKLGCNGPPG